MCILKNNFMFYKELKKYSRNLINSHYSKTGEVVNTLEIDDLINEAYVNSFNDLEDAKNIIRNYFLNEALILKSKRQFSSIESDYEKKCKACNKTKHNSEFTHRYDKRYGLHYLEYICLDCESEKRKSEEYKARRRELYNNSPRAKQKARERYLRWKKRNGN